MEHSHRHRRSTRLSAAEAYGLTTGTTVAGKVEGLDAFDLMRGPTAEGEAYHEAHGKAVQIWLGAMFGPEARQKVPPAAAPAAEAAETAASWLCKQCTHDACHSLDCGGREAGGARAPEKPSELRAVQSADADGNDLDVWFIDHRCMIRNPTSRVPNRRYSRGLDPSRQPPGSTTSARHPVRI